MRGNGEEARGAGAPSDLDACMTLTAEKEAGWVPARQPEAGSARLSQSH